MKRQKNFVKYPLQVQGAQGDIFISCFVQSTVQNIQFTVI